MFDPPIKADFLAHGLVACPVPDEDLECPIYREQFISALSTPSDTTESDSTTSLVDSATDEYTTPPPEDAESRLPIRMPCCNNIFCHHCINLWLNSVNTCPTCRVQLFEGPEPEPELEPELSESTESETSDFEEEYDEGLNILMEFDTDG
ncbi:hypothetical protein COCSADRAFT_270939 [Bipolaris sorokiniana ND90Pr]|uniref:RING-type domain-containing protein n=1 Tax=Cochliobolus sativus (strain ND90Pr / ATCC 201652) TaxID=665912 RepID=M2SM57_COCSN|nr:uncharacterized protein COCSADRAFT_270939 [Bipolaris sorokiniana ND90Pr]EMD68258.1 hypothetical protein COCSADRAFT_270939 [Bipolaris sorokiniana ND90Pr]